MPAGAPDPAVDTNALLEETKTVSNHSVPEDLTF